MRLSTFSSIRPMDNLGTFKRTSGGVAVGRPEEEAFGRDVVGEEPLQEAVGDEVCDAVEQGAPRPGGTRGERLEEEDDEEDCERQ